MVSRFKYIGHSKPIVRFMGRKAKQDRRGFGHVVPLELRLINFRVGRASRDCPRGPLVLISVCDRSPRHERRSLLLRNDVLRTHVFWREGRAELKFSDKPAPQSDPPPETDLAGGFSVLD